MPDAHRLGHRPGESRKPSKVLQVAEREGQEVLERIRGQKHEPSDPLGALGCEQLGDRASGVAGDEGDLGEVESRQQLGHQRSEARRGEVGVGSQRD